MRKKVQYQAVVGVICIAAMIGLIFMEQPQTYASQNDLLTWTNNTLHQGVWVKYNKQPFVANTPMETNEGIRYWVIKSNSTTILAVASEKTIAGPLGGEATSVSDFSVYTSNETWLAFPFTINIPKAQTVFAHNESFTCLAHTHRFDTIYFKFKIVLPHKEVIQEWLLDEDTHLARRVRVQTSFPNSSQPSRGYIMEATQSSVFLGNEVQFTANILGFISLIMGPILTATLLYKRQSKTVEKEKQRLQTEEYRKQYLEEHVEDQHR